MSRKLIESFFPAVTGLQRPTIIPHLLSELLPQEVAVFCPTPLFSFSIHGFGEPFIIWRPALAVSAILGIAVGLGGSVRILSLMTNRSNKRVPGVMDTNDSLILWSVAFLFFGMMNISGLCLHCLVPAYEKRMLVPTYPTLWAVDCFLTGCSSMCLIGAGLSNEFWYNKRGLEMLRLWLQPNRWVAVTLLLASCAVAAFLFLGLTSPLELWYLAVAAAATHVLLPVLWTSRSTGKMQQGTILLCAGILVCVVGLVFDSTACYNLGDALLDWPTAPNLLFLGCDIAFCGLFVWVRDRYSAKLQQDAGKME